MNRRNTKQREIILEIMKNDRSHPTIQDLCQKVRNLDSTIGQATVYRNVSKLCEEGILKKISTDIDHYDYIKIPHYHLYCNRCHQLFDIFDDNYFDKEGIEKKHHILIDYDSILLKGICEKCLDEEV